MGTVESIYQVINLLISIALAVGFLELVLFWLLYHFKRPFFISLTAVGGVTFGAGLGWLSGAGWTHPNFVGYGLLVALAFGLVSRFWLKGRFKMPIMMIAPAFISVCILIVYPFFFELNLAFHRLNIFTIRSWLDGEPIPFVGFDNFLAVFTSSPLQTVSFWQLLGRTFLWTGINLVFHVLGGLVLALLLNQIGKIKGIYRTLLIIPWAMPQVVAILAWRGEFHPQFGYINQILQQLGLGGVNWWSDPIPVFISCCIVNIWLGIPFMMIIFLGGLQSIPNSYYEAASIDGASPWVKFREITIPMLKPVVIPSMTLGTIWTFNNINVIYLMSGGTGGNEYADILISALYKAAFTYSRYSFSAAFAIIIFFILFLITMVWIRMTKGTESATV